MADSGRIPQVIIPLDEKMLSFIKQCGPALKDVFQSKFGCTAVYHGVDADRSPGLLRKPTVVPEKRYFTQLSKGMTVSVWKDDLTTHQVDAVVNAANTRLQHGGGLALALSDAGGPEIQQESDRYIQKNGQLCTGDAIVTKSGNLKCKKIIHAVGPSLPSMPSQLLVNQSTQHLVHAIENILKRMEEEKLRSVAIPAISSGLFNFPLHLCADTIVKTLVQYDRISKGKPLEIHLVNHDEPSVREMERACCKFLGQPQIAANTSYVSQGNGSNTTLKINNVTLNIKKGNIEEQKTTVIVNTIGSDFNLSNGAITKSITNAAGKGIQDEIRKKQNSYTNCVIETGGHNLHCSSVYHVTCPVKREGYEQFLGVAVLKCLIMAARKPHQSISFPAIGTGMLGYEKEVVAKVLMDSAVEFAKQRDMYLDIFYVIYPSDTATYKAFGDYLRTLQNRFNYSSSSSSSTQDFQPTKEHHKSRRETPYIELRSISEERVSEARYWLSKIDHPAFESFDIQNNFIQHFGQREYEELMSFQTKWSISLEEVFLNGCASVRITGSSDRKAAVVEVEAMCCKAQEEFAKEEESALAQITKSKVSYQRRPVDHSSYEYEERKSNFNEFKIVSVEKVENSCLKQVFELKKKQLSATPRRLYQCLSSQFCDLIGRVGFQREFAPPQDQKYGDGIYFCDSPSTAIGLWKNLADDKYLYFVEAQVLTGRSTTGSQGLILPPSRGKDVYSLYDSVCNINGDTFVIFNGYQAFPEYLITCIKPASSYV